MRKFCVSTNDCLKYMLCKFIYSQIFPEIEREISSIITSFLSSFSYCSLHFFLCCSRVPERDRDNTWVTLRSSFSRVVVSSLKIASHIRWQLGSGAGYEKGEGERKKKSFRAIFPSSRHGLIHVETWSAMIASRDYGLISSRRNYAKRLALSWTLYRTETTG